MSLLRARQNSTGSSNRKLRGPVGGIIKEQVKGTTRSFTDKRTREHSCWEQLALSCCAATGYRILVYAYMKAGADHAIDARTVTRGQKLIHIGSYTYLHMFNDIQYHFYVQIQFDCKSPT